MWCLVYKFETVWFGIVVQELQVFGGGTWEAASATGAEAVEGSAKASDSCVLGSGPEMRRHY